MTLKMTTAQVVETSVTVTNSSFQNYTHPDDHTTRTITSFAERNWLSNFLEYDLIFKKSCTKNRAVNIEFIQC